MDLRSTYIKVLICLLSLGFPICSSAVTQKEMEQARTIAAQAYIRWANDGSGYLDEYHPKTMEELEALLKPKEQENIKAFKAIAVPGDYQSWNKDRLVEFWVNAFQDPGLLEKGRGGRIRARSLIGKMTVSAPAPVAENTAVAVEPSAAPSTPEQSQTQLNELKADEKAIENADVYVDDIDTENASSYTWVYIMILAILVGIVIWLVVYAASVFKKNGSSTHPYKVADNGVDKERYEEELADKDAEIAMLVKKLETAMRQNGDLKAKLDNAQAELTMLRASSRRQAPGVESRVPEMREQQRRIGASEQREGLRSIYLGRANAKGLFVRADRKLNPGNSVYILETTDGKTGSFRVADSPAVWNLALSNPAEYLEGGCTGYDLGDTEYAVRIVTESPGTAVFEDGCWRVVRKARIRYEE